MIRSEKNIKNFGIRIRELRKQNNYTQEDLAVILSTSRSYIVKLENGKIEIKLGTLFKICKAFKISIKDLFNFPYDI